MGCKLFLLQFFDPEKINQLTYWVTLGHQHELLNSLVASMTQYDHDLSSEILLLLDHNVMQKVAQYRWMVLPRKLRWKTPKAAKSVEFSSEPPSHLHQFGAAFKQKNL